jgi:hypothetical protein
MTSSNKRLYEDILWTNEIKTTSSELVVGMYFMQGLYEHSPLSFLAKKRLDVLFASTHE